MSPSWILLELTMTYVVVTTAAIKCVKLQSDHHHQQTNTQLFLQARCPSIPSNQQGPLTKGTLHQQEMMEVAPWQVTK